MELSEFTLERIARLPSTLPVEVVALAITVCELRVFFQNVVGLDEQITGKRVSQMIHDIERAFFVRTDRPVLTVTVVAGVVRLHVGQEVDAPAEHIWRSSPVETLDFVREAGSWSNAA